MSGLVVARFILAAGVAAIVEGVDLIAGLGVALVVLGVLAVAAAVLLIDTGGPS